MLDLTYEKTIHIDKWDIDVVPYLTVEEMGYIVNDLLTCENGLERDMKLIADVLVACTDLYNQNEDMTYTYEDVLYSGFWADLLHACPILKDNIQVIYREVKEFNSINKAVMGLIDKATEKLNEINVADFDLSKLDFEEVNKFISNVNKQLEK